MTTIIKKIWQAIKTPYAATFFALIIFGVALFMTSIFFTNAEITQAIEAGEYQPSLMNILIPKGNSIFFFPAWPAIALLEPLMDVGSDDVLLDLRGILLLPFMLLSLFCLSALVWSLPIWGLIYFC